MTAERGDREPQALADPGGGALGAHVPSLSVQFLSFSFMGFFLPKFCLIILDPPLMGGFLFRVFVDPLQACTHSRHKNKNAFQ